MQKRIKKKSASQYESILSSIPEIIMEIDNDQLYTWANKAGIEFFGEDVLGKGTDHYLESNPASIEKVNPTYWGNNETDYFENWQRRRDGENRLLGWSARTLKDKSGTIIGKLLTARDITEYRIQELETNEKKEKFSDLSKNTPINDSVQTEQKLAELEIQKSAKIINATSDAVIATDTTGIITFWNKGAKRIYKYSAKEVIGKPVSILYKEEDFSVLNSLITELLQGKKIYEREVTCIDKDGNHVEILLSLMVLKDDDGNVTELVGITKDITERKQSEELLLKNKNRLEYALNSIDTGAWELDLTVKDAWRSFKHDQIFGYTELLPKWTFEMFIEHVIPEDREYVIKRFETALEENKEWHFECRIKRVDGAIRWIMAKGKQEIVEEKESGKMFGIVQDITKRKVSEQSLTESEEFLRSIVENSLNAIMVADDKGNYTLINSAAANMFGYSREQMLEMNISQISTIQKPDAEKRYKNYLEKGQEIGEFEFFNSNGENRIAQYHAVRIRDNFNLSVLSDITERKKVEAKIIESESNLIAFINNTDDSIWSLDRDYNYLIFNNTYAKIFSNSYGFELKKGINAKKQLKKEEYDFWIPLFDDALRGEKKVFEFTHDFNGVTHHFQTHLNPIFEGDRVTGVSARSVDITERKKNEEKITTQLNELRRWHSAMLNREERTMELKREVNDLLLKAGKSIRYKSVKSNSY